MMKMIDERWSRIGVGLVAVASLSMTALAGPPFAEHAESGKSLVVPESDAELGTVYHALTDRSVQITFTSDAPLEDIKGQSSRVIGYAVAGPPGRRAQLQAGEWHLPVASMRTGIELRDEHLQSDDWLNADDHPHIVFQLAETRSVQPTKSGEGFATYSATLVGDMTVNGVTRKVTIAGASITFQDESSRTRSFAAGDLLAIRAKYSVSLKDYDVSHPTIGEKVSETVEIDTKLYLSTVPPEQQPSREG